MQTDKNHDAASEATDLAGPMIGWLTPGRPLPAEFINPVVQESAAELRIRVHLPGFPADKVAVSLEGAELRVRAERPEDQQVLDRTFMLSAALDLAQVRARLRAETLVITAPKRPDGSRVIPVDVDADC